MDDEQMIAKIAEVVDSYLDDLGSDDDVDSQDLAENIVIQLRKVGDQ